MIKSVGAGSLNERELHNLLKIARDTTMNPIVLSDDVVKYAMGLSMLQSSALLLVNDKLKLSKIIKKSLNAVMAY